MKRERFASALTAAVLSFCLGYGGTAAMVTGLTLEADLWALLVWCLPVSLALALLMCYRRGGFAVGGIALLSVVYAMSRHGFRQDLYSMLGHIGTYYDNGYGIGVPEVFLESTGWSHLMPLVLIHVLISAMTSWSLVRRYPMVLAIALGVLPMASCFVVVDTVPALWCILLWLFGLIVILMTHPVRQRDEGHGNRLTRIIAVPVALGLVLLSLCVPREGYETPQFSFVDLSSLWDWMESDGGNVTFLPTEQVSLSQTLELDGMGERKLTNTPVLEVSASFSGTLYLRGRDYDRYDGKSWHASEQRMESNFMTSQNFRNTGTVRVRTLKTFRQRFIPYYPSQTMIFRDGMVDNPEQLTEYSYDCVKPYRDEYAVMPRKTVVDERYLELPEHTRQEAEKILSQMDFMDGGNAGVAYMVGNYVRGSAQYDLKTPAMPTNREDFALWFLEESDTGYCVHFASAATVLLRAAGVPARYVEGYVLNTGIGRVTTVTERSAHAWVEYFDPGLGWVILEATPGYGDMDTPEPPEETTEPTETEPTETEPTEPSEDPTDPPETTVPSETTLPTQTTAPDSEEQTEPDSAPKEPFRLPDWLITVLKVLGIILLALALLVGQWFLRRRRILRKMHRGNSNAQALARYREMQRLSRFLKTPVPDQMRSLAERACFSQHQITPEQLQLCNQHLQQCTDALRQKKLPVRLVYRFVLALY